MQPIQKENTQKIKEVLVVFKFESISMMNIFTHMLSDKGNMVLAITAAEGFDNIAKKHFDAAIVQRDLPDMGGDLFAKTVRENSKMPVLVVNSSNSNDLMNEFSLTELTKQIHDLLSAESSG